MSDSENDLPPQPERKSVLRNALEAIDSLQARLDAVERDRQEPIAIVGLACRFPGADSADEFWRLLEEARCSVTEVPADRWDKSAFFDPDPSAPGKMHAPFGGFLDGIDRFDAAFFGISGREAESMDPQQRLLLEVTWEALENAGIAADRLRGSQGGVFVGITTSDYGRMAVARDVASLDVYTATGGALNVAAGRIAYVLGLNGPAVAIDSACSSSLVAIHLACQSLRNRECDFTLAGGVNVLLAPEPFVCFAKWGMMATDGKCKTFDEKADGFVRSEGCGIVVLKRLSDAQAAGDRILAVIRGTAVNQDGASSGLTVPNGLAQQAVVRTALKNAHLTPADIDYIEAHGTGTTLGDPIELEALAAVLGPQRSSDLPLRVGSVKTNIGHTESASGVAGLIKVVLSLQQEKIPAHLHFHKLNPRLSLGGAPIQIPTQVTPWVRQQRPRIAGVSSFGFSGTNAHVILQESPAVAPAPPLPAQAAHLLVLSARSAPALRDLARAYARYFSANLAANLRDVCQTAAAGRAALPHRLALVASSPSDCQTALNAFAAGAGGAEILTGKLSHAPRIAFVFTGQGAQYPGMGRALYVAEPVYREAFDHCAELMRADLDRPLTEIIGYAENPAAAEVLNETRYTQPALFALEYALATLWRSWGIEPAAVVGHSLGEYVAACVAGVLSLEDALRLVALRSRLMQALPRGGAMLAVLAPEDQVQPWLAPYAATVAIAALNSPKNTVISGRADDIHSLAKLFLAKGIETRPLHVSHAFHSPLVEPMLDALELAARGVTYHPPAIDLVLNATGDFSDEAAPIGAAYWRRHARGTVRFADSVRALHARGITTFLEIGPSPVLIGLARQCVNEAECTWLSSLRKDHEAWPQLLGSLGALFVAGANPNWGKFDQPPAGNRLALPAYPFQRERFWLPETNPAAAGVASVPSRAGVHPLLGVPVPLAGRPGEFLWRGELSLEICPWVDDHRVQGAAIVPATAYVEMAIAAAVSVAGQPPVVLTKIEIEKPLLLRAGLAFETQTRLEGAITEPMTFQIFSRARDENGAWTLHARGIVRVGTAGAAPSRLDPVQREEIQKSATRVIEGAEFYRLHHERGNEWGPLFQGVGRVWQGSGEALSEIAPPARIRGELGHYLFHPALSDSSGHVLTATIPLEKSSGIRGGAFVGAGIEDICFYRRSQGGRLWAHARLRDPQEGPPNTLIGDVFVYDETGEIISKTSGARLWYLDSAQKSDGLEPVESWFYAPRWVTRNVAVKTETAMQATGTWIVFRDRQGVGDALGALLRARGSDCLYVDHATPVTPAAGMAMVVAPAQAESYPALLTAARKLKSPVRGVVHLWSLDAAAPEQADFARVQQAEVLGPLSVLRLVQALESVQPAMSLKLWLATRGAQPASDTPAPLAILQAPLWGLGRTIAVEKSDLWGGQMDLDPAEVPAEAAQNILHQMTEHDGEDQVAFRGGQRKVLRLARLVAPVGRSPADVIRPDASYLVTGGLGGIGLEFARWLARHGARHLVLAARSSVPPRDHWDKVPAGTPEAGRVEAVRSIEQLGATVRTIATDFGDEQAVRELIADCRRAGQPALRGVFHAAGVMQYEALGTQTSVQMRQVLSAKVTGGWLLHRLLSDVPLDLFVLFSSSSSLLSSPLMGGYSAANVFLDALAHHRRGLGLPAMSINWGTWAEAGMATRFQSTDESKRQGRSGATKGIGTLSTRRALEAWERLLDADVPQAGVMPINWEQWQQAYGGLAATAYLSLLVKAPIRATAELDSARARRDSILHAGPELRREPVELYLAEQMSVILKVSLETIDVDKSIAGLGFDSLMSIELKNKIEADLRVSVAMARLIQGPTLTELAGMILELLQAAPVDESSARPVAAAEEFEEGSL